MYGPVDIENIYIYSILSISVQKLFDMSLYSFLLIIVIIVGTNSVYIYRRFQVAFDSEDSGK